MKAFPLISGTNQENPLSTLLFNIGLNFRQSHRRKEINVALIRKEEIKETL
jgi:hypothetical protein